MEYDYLLYRSLKSGSQYDHLIPKVKCESTLLGDGMTDFSILKMSEWIHDYNWQTQELAEVLEKNSLEENVNVIKDFAFNHFQYKADDDDQMLRSPACSWYVRKEGIDCKSYSIIASCLLTNMGITHYIRKIKQPGFAPEEFTHVYVVIPKDQKTGNLEKGYYTIDGTLQSNAEPEFIETSDLLMKHYGLNYAHQANGLNGFDLNSLKNLFDLKKISFGSFKAIFAELLCGDSAYKANEVEGVLVKIQDYFQSVVKRINAAVVAGDTKAFADAVAEFKGMSFLLVESTEKCLATGWNSCTTKRIKINLAALKFYREIGGRALDAWLTANFDKQPFTNPYVNNPSVNSTTNFVQEMLHNMSVGNDVRFTNTSLEQKYGFRFTNTTPATNVQQHRYLYTTKANINEVKAFELTAYVASVTSTSAFNDQSYLQTLTQVAAVFSPSGTGTAPINPSTGLPYGNLNDDIDDPKQAGTSVIGVALLIGGILGIGKLLLSPSDNKAKTSKIPSKK